MQITKEAISKTKIKLKIKLDVKELVPHIEKVYQGLAKGLKIAGFRPGKAPQFIVEREVGQDKFYAEVLDEVLPKAYYDAIVQEKIFSVGRPEVRVIKYVPTEGLEFEAEVEIIPEIILPDYQKIKIKKNKVQASDKDIEELIGNLREQAAEFKAIERAAKKGDRVEIDFEGVRNNVPIQGGTSKNHPLIIGQGMFVPGFEDNLVGMKKDEEKTFDVTFPTDYHEKSLANQKVTFKVKMISVSEKIMPELTDDFARKLGPFKNIKELQEAAEKNIKETKEASERRRIEEEILKRISEKVELEIPEGLIHQEIQKMMDEADSNLKNSGLTLEKYLEMQKKTKKDIEREMRPEAEKRVKYGLILSKISQEEKIKTSKEEIEKEKEILLETFGEKANEARKQLDNHETEHSIENSIIAKKTIDKLVEYCLSS